MLSAPGVKDNQCMLLLEENVWRGCKQRRECPSVTGAEQGRARRADGTGTSQGNDYELQYEPQMEMEVEEEALDEIVAE
jgi:hypothetical protein